MSRPFDVATLDEIETVAVPGAGVRWTAIRRHFDVRAFGVNAYVGEREGDHVVEEHTEGTNRHEELYAVLAGRAVFTVAGETFEAPAGTLVFVRDPDARRGATAAEAGTRVLAIGGVRGGAYEPSPWEHWFAAYAYADAGDPARGVEELERAIAERPDHPILLYHLACLETRVGRTDDALEHVTRAAQLDERVREWAREDEDLEAIRGDPRFPA